MSNLNSNQSNPTEGKFYLGYFDLIRWIQQLRKYDQPDTEKDKFYPATAGEAIDGALWEIKFPPRMNGEQGDLYIWSGDPFYNDARIPEFLDTIINPVFRDMVDEELAKLTRFKYVPVTQVEP